MTHRSNRPEVRNPVLALDSAKAILALPLDQRLALAELLMELSRDARQRAEKAWATRKPPMALYWSATAVVAKHIARALRRRAPTVAEAVPWSELDKAAA